MGIPCVTADPADIQKLQAAIAAHPQASVTLDLEAMQVSTTDLTIPVIMVEGSRNMFISGTWDACGQLVAQAEKIRATAIGLPYVSWGKATA
jgi:3-isopropylmalate/(R)-2-methylmalate dehydratase small subunit